MLTKCLRRILIPRTIYACSNLPPKVHTVLEEHSASYTLESSVPGTF